MSLQVWLPLNGSLENKGLDSNITFYNNSGATINSDGKIGTCYYFDGTDDWINFNINKHDYENKSVCLVCWFKSNLIDTDGVLIDIAADICLTFLYNSTNGVRFGYWRCYKNSKGNRAGDGSYITPYYDATKWHHIVYISNKSINTLYVDGEFAASVDKSNLYTNYWIPLLPDTTHIRLNIGRSSGDLSWCGGYINDVRVYDHCLSAKEVKEISKGLILHYKLDDPYIEPTTNLWSKNLSLPISGWETWATSGYTKPSIQYLTDDGVHTNNYLACTVYGNSSSYNWRGPFKNDSNVEINTFYTYSCYIKGSPNSIGKNIAFTTGANGITVNNVKSMNIKLSDTWLYIVCSCFVVEKTGTNPRLLPGFNDNSLAIGNDVTFYVCNCQKETKDHATPWVLGETTRNESIIYDSSGYEHNSNIKNELTISSDTPKYSLSTHFVDGSYLISPWTILGIIPTDALTANIWVKYDSAPASNHWTFFSCTLSSGFAIGASSGKLQFWVYCASVGYKTATSTINASSLIGNWHMLTGTCDRQNIKLYLDTEEIATISWSSDNLIGVSSSVPLVIGGEAKSSTTQAEYSDFTGSLSDARIYATALSSEDILELYRTGASIDNKGNMYARELVEE